MDNPRFPALALSVASFACALCFAAASAGGFSQAPSTPGDSKPPAKDAAEKSALPALPPAAHAQQQITLDGKPLKYTVTIGTIPVRDKDGKTAGQVVTTAYTVEGENRPVTFALNGGPGAASVYLNFGALGPSI